MNLLHVYLKGWRMLLLCVLSGTVLALGISAVQPWRYSSTIRLLIMQTNATGLDPYTAIKSTERIGQNLSELVYSSSFFNAVMAQNVVDKSYFPTDEIDKRKAWKEAVETVVTPGTGIMQVTAYHTDRAQATALATGVAKELADQAPNYFGYSVRVQIIDDPLPSRFVAKPDFLQNGAIGLMLGFLLGSILILARIRQIK